MIKIGVISDTHAYRYKDLPVKLIQGLTGVDLILHAGDILDLEVLEGLQKITPQVKAVWGNMDPLPVRQTLRDKEVIQIKQFRIGLTHGTGAPFNLMQNVAEKFKQEHVNCIVFGHSHAPKNELYQDILYFNPGSPTDKFFTAFNSYGILEADKTIVGKIIKI